MFLRAAIVNAAMYIVHSYISHAHSVALYMTEWFGSLLRNDRGQIYFRYKIPEFFMANWQSRFLNVSLCYTEALLCQYHYVCKQRFNWIIQITHNDAITDLCLNSEFITLVGFFSFCCHSLFFLLCHAADKSAFR